MICLLSTAMICYANEYDDYVDSVNCKYNLKIEKKDNVEQICTFDEFKKHVDSIVESQLNYRQNEMKKTKNVFKTTVDNITSVNSYSTVTKTKDSTANSFKIKATYDYNNGTLKNVKNFRDISWIYKYKSIIMYYKPYNGYPKVSIIDGGRTGVVKYNGVFSDPYNKVENYSFSAEFYSP